MLIDTNVLIDYMIERQPFYNEAKEIIGLCADSVIDGCIAAHSVTDSFYIMRKFPKAEARELLTQMCEIMTVVGIDGKKLIAAINSPKFDDLEDCLQSVCAEDCKAEYIITRNTKDFSGSNILPITPAEFLGKITQMIL
ncbi:MAG: PIN domain-containing protein [Firmicutes bacterium]|nr:PIN domain-containing protein [[Eubacterium] siraeum]MCM1488314.1 PIN domain-containing protein [Bacillota bacterium]